MSQRSRALPRITATARSQAGSGHPRLVTIVFADVSGFTALSQQLDHEIVNQVMRACWAELDQVILNHGGRVDKHIGDALMATFGTTVTHEDDPLQAVRAALALQGALVEFAERLEAATGFAIRMRCGVAAGEVTVGRVADSTQEISVGGPVVGLAEALEAACPVGSVLVDPSVQAATHLAIEYRTLDPRPLAGLEGLTSVYEALGERAAGEVASRPAELETQAGPGARGRDSAALRPASGAVGERRLVTTLFADIPGFDALAERLDPQEVGQIMRACWAELDEVVLHNGGTVDKHVGTALMGTFGATAAHEDDSLRAVRTGLTLQKRLVRFWASRSTTADSGLRLRCGIAAGEVTVDRVAASTEEFSVIGPAVNLASRIEHECPEGSVFVDEAVYQATEWAIEYRRLEPRPIKGIDGLVPIFEALAERESADRGASRSTTGTPANLVGREREQDLLRAALDDALASRGRVVAVVGEGGMGKSTLVGALHRAAEAKPARWVEGHCLSYASTDPYGLVREVVQHLLNVHSGMSHETVVGRLTAALVVAAGPPPSPDDSRSSPFGGDQIDPELGEGDPIWSSALTPGYQGDPELGEIGTSWNAAALTLEDRCALIAQMMVGHDAGVTGGDALGGLDPPTRRRLTEQALVDLLLAQVREGPLVLNLEDLHWCDPESHQVVTTLANALADKPLLLLVQSRPEGDLGWLDLPHVSTVRLEPLAPDETLLLVRSALRTLAPPPGPARGSSTSEDQREETRNGTAPIGSLSTAIVELAARLHEATQGNPYFIVEMVRSLTESGQLIFAEGQWEMAAAAEGVALPASTASCCSPAWTHSSRASAWSSPKRRLSDRSSRDER
ncbi:MAG: hypothetical protein EXR58_00300 [Chloroflexi bacterium]|nr:hypothetical protein [Chloroflexota bacterium]